MISPCGGIPEIAGAEFVQQLRARERAGPQVPFSASMDWTARCNLRCRHCYVRSRQRNPPEMGQEEVRLVLDRLAEAGVLFLVVTGGEPLLRRDFRDLHRHAKRRGFVLTLYSNGTLVDEAMADFLADHPPRRVEVSVYGHTAETYESVTGVPGSFERFRRGVDRLLSRGLLVRLKSMLMTLNLSEFADMKAWAEGLGCDFRYDALIHGRLDGDRAPVSYRISPQDVTRLHFAAEGDKAEFLRYIEGLGPELRPREKLFECGAGTMTLHVDERGQVHPCMLWRGDPYDLLRGPLDGAWLRHIAGIRDRRAPEGKCRSCRDRGLCSYCPPIAVLETGDVALASPFHCRLAAERKRQCRL